MPPKFTPNIQWTLLKYTNQIHSDYIYGAITLYGLHIPVQVQLLQAGPLTIKTYYTTSSPLLLGGIQFILCRVRSTLLTASRLFSFPLPTKMFQFGRFPLHIGSISKRRKWEVPLGNPGFKGCMLLAQAISLLAATLFGDSSQAIPQMV